MKKVERTPGPLAEFAAKKRLENAAPDMLAALKRVSTLVSLVHSMVDADWRKHDITSDKLAAQIREIEDSIDAVIAKAEQP